MQDLAREVLKQVVLDTVPDKPSDFKLVIDIRPDDYYNNRMDITPIQIDGKTNFVMVWTKSTARPVKLVFDDIDNLIKWFLVDRVPCFGSYSNVYVINIHTVPTDTVDNYWCKDYGQVSFKLSDSDENKDTFKRCLLNCASMSFS